MRTMGTARLKLVMAVAGVIAVVAGGAGAPAPAGDLVPVASDLALGNYVANPSFESTTAPWTPTRARLQRVAVQRAPHGRYVASARWTGRRSSFAVTTTSTARTVASGSAYTASAFVASVNAAARGRRSSLVVREIDSSGAVIRTWTGQPVVLNGSYQRLTATAHAAGPGHRIQLQVVVLSPGRRATVQLDAVTLRATAVAPGAPTASAVTTPTPSPTASVEATTSASATPVAPVAPTLGLLALAAGSAAHMGDTSRYGIIVLHQQDADRIPAIRAANPATRVLVYLDAAVTRQRSCAAGDGGSSWTNDGVSMNVGVDYCWLVANGHRDWILKNADGSDLTFTDYPGYLVMDAANAGYQRQFAAGIVMAARHDESFDGVYLDDVNTSVGHGLANAEIRRLVDGSLVTYDNSAYGADMVSFVHGLRQALEADPVGRTLRRMANVYADPWDPAPADRALQIAADVDVFNREHQSQWLVGGACGPYKPLKPAEITAVQRFATDVQARGTAYSSIEYGSSSVPTSRDRELMRFSRASWLMSWNGASGGVSFFVPCFDSANPAAPDFADWTTELGLPTGPVEVRESGQVRWYPTDQWTQQAELRVRPFENGIVIQNTFTTARVVALDGTYRDTAGVLHTGTVTLSPAAPYVDSDHEGVPGSAMLLTRVS